MQEVYSFWECREDKGYTRAPHGRKTFARHTLLFVGL